MQTTKTMASQRQGFKSATAGPRPQRHRTCAHRHQPLVVVASFRSVALRPASSSTRPSSTASRSRVAAHTRSRTHVVQVQANLFSRLSRVIKSYVDSFVGSFEDPERLLDRVVDEMTQDAARMRMASAQAIASQRQMTARATNMQANADQWLRRAELAVARGQDDLAREALSRRKVIQVDADRLAQQATAQQNACDQLSGSVRMLESKIAEARGKKETLKARAASAKSSMAVQEMIGGLRTTGASSFAAFDKMEEKVMTLEAEAQSMAAMSTPDALESRFALMEVGNVEDELKALKAGINRDVQRQVEAALPRPRVADAFVPNMKGAMAELDLELEELRRRARS